MAIVCILFLSSLIWNSPGRLKKEKGERGEEKEVEQNLLYLTYLLFINVPKVVSI